MRVVFLRNYKSDIPIANCKKFFTELSLRLNLTFLFDDQIHLWLNDYLIYELTTQV